MAVRSRLQKARRLVKLIVKPKPSFEIPPSRPDYLHMHPYPGQATHVAYEIPKDTPARTSAYYCSPTDSYVHRRSHGYTHGPLPSLKSVSPLRFGRLLNRNNPNTPTRTPTRSVKEVRVYHVLRVILVL
ncbi:hypothetical protein BV22DRAFT_487102 [Leucogyrophana mollusca]|uniref:Uncharacterized protein n=1 Tax=Leucogyrophana mollusca TaxID=85980 RepID=A0ACB8BG76_9AGAM|nr:hypothetical protein BV22DRAFT_487102 [Leucogyrophana mollusca]